MLKRVLILLAIILPASASTATVLLTCEDLGDGVVELSYDFSQESSRVRAFALDIRVSAGIITSVGNPSSNYWVYPGSIYIDKYGEVVDFGSPVAPPDIPGTLGGIGTDGMTIEMGALYHPDDPVYNTPPPPTGVLLTFTVSTGCDVTVAENAIRGGVVLENATSANIYAPPLLGVLPPKVRVYSGTGTTDDPYLISTSEHLNAIGVNPGDWSKYFKLVADIDLSCFTAKDFHLIGTTRICPFSGVFDGNNHKIYNFTYNWPSNYVGLFGYVDSNNAQIKDLCLVNPSINTGIGRNVGSLVGYLEKGTISLCCAVGGSVCGGDCIGGLVGRNYKGTITNCYARTKVLGRLNLGGLVGRAYEMITNCYSTGLLPQDANIIGGLAGYNHGIISNSFWDRETSGQENAAGVTGEMGVTYAVGETTVQMQTAAPFVEAGWDFEGESDNGSQDIWTIREGQTYPRFVQQIPTGDFAGREGVDMTDFAFLASHWRESNCANSSNCDGTDLDRSGTVDAADLMPFINNWLCGVD